MKTLLQMAIEKLSALPQEEQDWFGLLILQTLDPQSRERWLSAYFNQPEEFDKLTSDALETLGEKRTKLQRT